jgi:hypothetical protein
VVPTPEPILDYVASMNIVRSGQVEEERAVGFVRNGVERRSGAAEPYGSIPTAAVWSADETTA